MWRCSVSLTVFLTVVSIITITSCVAKTVITKTPTGAIEGYVTQEKGQEVAVYLGIPYAEPPTGELRLAKPLKKGYFEETFKATEMGPSCIQLSIPTPVSEDCLSLNIFAPMTNKSAPASGGTLKAVMVFIHGGWWQYGMQAFFYAPEFASGNDVILVTMNYRLNEFGFLANEDYGLRGNYGLWDQQMAITWVHDNIRAFGGDVTRVTLIGHSAGAASAVMHALYPGNKGLFQAVIAQSGSPLAPWVHNSDYKALFMEFVERYGCDHEEKNETVRCLRNQTTIIPDNDYRLITSRLHLPVYDGEFITFKQDDFDNIDDLDEDLLERLSSVNLMIGLTSSDGSWNYREWTRRAAEVGGDFNLNGLSVSEFKHVSKYLDVLLNLNFTTLEKEAIFHQYIDWSNPTNLSSNRAAFLDLSKDLEFTSSIFKIAAAHAHARSRGSSTSGSGGLTYVYEFDRQASFSDLPMYIQGPVHQDDLPFVFGFTRPLLKSRGIDVDPTRLMTKEEFELTGTIQSLWTTFAKTSEAGNLSSVLALPWTPYTEADGTYLKLRTDGVTSRTFYRGSAVHFWNSLMPKLRGGAGMSVSEIWGGVVTRLERNETCITSGNEALRPTPKMVLGSVVLVLVVVLHFMSSGTCV